MRLRWTPEASIVSLAACCFLVTGGVSTLRDETSFGDAFGAATFSRRLNRSMPGSFDRYNVGRTSSGNSSCRTSNRIQRHRPRGTSRPRNFEAHSEEPLDLAPELEASLAEAGIRMARRRLQRFLKEICEEDGFYVECDTRSKPYGYRQRIPSSDLAVTNLRPQESLLLRLAEEHLKYQLPSPLVRASNRSSNRRGPRSRKTAPPRR